MNKKNNEMTVPTHGIRMNRLWRIIARMAAWGIAFGFPLITWKRNEDFSLVNYMRYLASIFTFVALFYANYSYLVKRFLFRRQVRNFVIINIVLSIVLLYGAYSFFHLFPEPFVQPHRPTPPENISFWRFLGAGMGFCVLVCAVSVASKMTGSWYKAEDERKELERSRTQAELQNLKSQLNPHFLFNTLNNIYSMIAISPERAQDAVHELGRLLRYVLYESSSAFVSLEKELNFVKNYVELMRIRLPKHVELEINVPAEACPSSEIAPLLFIAPIENAFKHGVSNNQPSFIRILIEIDGGHLRCRIVNSYFPKSESDRSGSGIGIANLRKRLSLIYPDRHVLRCDLLNSAYVSELEIDLPPNKSKTI